MAFLTPRFASSLRALTRYPLSPFSHRVLTSISEQSVLDEISDLLPIVPKPPNPRVFHETPSPNPTSPRTSDNLLSPDDKLRGVFLQNLKGKSSLSSALSSTGVVLTPTIFSDVLNRGSLSGTSMISFFNWAINQSGVPRCVYTYNVLLKSLGRRKFFDHMDEFLHQMRSDGMQLNPETVEILIDSLVRARRVSKATQMFEILDEIGYCNKEEAFGILVSCLARRGHVGVADSLFSRARGEGEIRFSSMVYNEIIGGWAKFGRVDKVQSYWVVMEDEGLSPDEITYSHLIEAFGRSRRMDDAVDAFVKMEEKGCAPGTVAYSAIISNFISVGDLGGSMRYFRGMAEKGCLPDIETYYKLISAFLKVRRVADALELFDEMLDRQILPSAGMITSFIEPLCSFGPPHAAMMFYKKSRKVGCTISLKAYKLLLMRLSRFGKCGMVLKLWEEMQDSGHNSDKEVYEYIVNGLCNIGHVDNAVLVLEESLRRGFCLGKVVYSKLNNKLLEMNKVEIAYKLFLKVKDARTHANSQSFWRSNGWHF